MNRIWSVFSGPYLVATVVPSISGSRSRWTPSRLTEPPRTSLTAILSISSRKTMPFASASASATRLMSSGSTRLSASSSVSRANASGTLSLRRLRGCWPDRLAHHRLQVEHLPAHAGDLERHRRRLVDLDLDLGLVEAAVGEALAEAFAGRLARSLAGQRVEQPFHRRFLGAGAHLASRRRSRSSRTASSTRSRAICSTSRPT